MTTVHRTEPYRQSRLSDETESYFGHRRYRCFFFS